MKKNSKGITIIALILTIIVMLILAAVSVDISTNLIDKAHMEDLKTTMLLIKGRVQIVVDKQAFNDTYDNTGMLAYADASIYTDNIPEELASRLTDTSNLYIWEQTAMRNNNITDVEITEEDFFIIDYSTREIYYSQGFEYEGTTYYSLTEMQEISE